MKFKISKIRLYYWISPIVGDYIRYSTPVHYIIIVLSNYNLQQILLPNPVHHLASAPHRSPHWAPGGSVMGSWTVPWRLRLRAMAGNTAPAEGQDTDIQGENLDDFWVHLRHLPTLTKVFKQNMWHIDKWNLCLFGQHHVGGRITLNHVFANKIHLVRCCQSPFAKTWGVAKQFWSTGAFSRGQKNVPVIIDEKHTRPWNQNTRFTMVSMNGIEMKLPSGNLN